MTKFGKVLLSVFMGLLLLAAAAFLLPPGSFDLLHDRLTEVFRSKEEVEVPEEDKKLRYAERLEEVLQKEPPAGEEELLRLSRRNDAVGYRASLELAHRKATNAEGAARFFRRALALHTTSEVRLELANYLKSRGLHSEAREVYRKLLPDREALEGLLQLEVEPSLIGLDLLENDMWNEAVDLMGPLIQNDPSKELRHGYARALVELERFEEALPFLEELREELDPGQEIREEVEFFYARTLEALGEKEEALRVYTLLGPRGNHRRGLLLEQEGYREEAAEAFSNALDPSVQWIGARRLEELGSSSKALPVYKELARGSSSLRDDAAYRAYILLTRKGDPEADVFLRKLSHHPAWLDRLGKEPRWSAAPKISPAKPDFLGRAEAYRQSGRGDLAELEMAIGEKLATPAERLYLGEWYLQEGHYYWGVRQGIQLLEKHPSREAYELAYPKPFEPLVAEAAEDYLVDPFLLLAVMREESRFQPEVVSWAGAVGLMQIMPSTGEEIARRKGFDDFVVDDLLDPETSIRFGAWYLRSRLNNFENDLDKALAAYNAGAGNARRWSRSHLGEEPGGFPTAITYRETREYITRVRDSYLTYRWLYGDEGQG